MAKKRKPTGGDGDLFIEGSGQLRLVDKSAEQQALENGKVECLGMTFDSDDARRAYFTDRLREKLADPEFRNTPGSRRGQMMTLFVSPTHRITPPVQIRFCKVW